MPDSACAWSEGTARAADAMKRRRVRAFIGKWRIVVGSGPMFGFTRAIASDASQPSAFEGKNHRNAAPAAITRLRGVRRWIGARQHGEGDVLPTAFGSGLLSREHAERNRVCIAVWFPMAKLTKLKSEEWIRTVVVSLRPIVYMRTNEQPMRLSEAAIPV